MEAGERMERVNLAERLASVDDLWSPRTIAAVNDYDVKLVKVNGEFVWHRHEETDELFLVLKGTVTIKLRDRDMRLGAGEIFVVPRGVEHCPFADGEAHILLLEPRGTVNTGNVRVRRTGAGEQPI